VTALPQRLLDIVPNAVHVHSRAGLPEHECQGEQTQEEIIASAAALGLAEVFLTEHTTNPGVGGPHFFEIEDSLGQAIQAHMNDVQRYAEMAAFGLYPGLEANILPRGGLDVPMGLTHDAALVIASQHGHVPSDPEEVTRQLTSTMGRVEVDMIGHAQRYVNVYGVDWETVFRSAGQFSWPTIIEANFNAWFTYGPVKHRRKGDHEGAVDAEKKEIYFLQALGRSYAPVVVSLDIHNAGMWPTDQPAADWMPTHEHLEEYLDLLFSCGIAPERIINRNLRDWLLLPKSDRGKLMSWL
jgi:histidinol phosphatase-like PHP family hydrolase